MSVMLKEEQEFYLSKFLQGAVRSQKWDNVSLLLKFLLTARYNKINNNKNKNMQLAPVNLYLTNCLFFLCTGEFSMIEPLRCFDLCRHSNHVFQYIGLFLTNFYSFGIKTIIIMTSMLINANMLVHVQITSYFLNRCLFSNIHRFLSFLTILAEAKALLTFAKQALFLVYIDHVK